MKTPKTNYSKPGTKTTGLLQVGLIFALGITLVGFEYANADINSKKVITSKIDNIQDEIVYDDFEIKKPEVPVDNPPTDQRKVMNANSTVQQITTNVQTTTNQTQVTTNVGINTSDSVVIVDLTKKEKPKTNEIFDVVEEMPTYTACIGFTNKTERKKETELLLLKNLYRTIKYPEMARQTGVQGKVWVQFVVNTEGDITNVEILKGVHSDLDNEAIRAVKTLPKMIPGKQRDQVVNVRYKIPVEFKLQH